MTECRGGRKQDIGEGRIVRMQERKRAGDKKGPGGKKRGCWGEEVNVCPNVVFFPEIAITQMRCWLEGRRASVSLLI